MGSDGGLACLLPYMFMAGMNGVFSAVRVYTVVLRFGTLLPCSERFMCLLPSWLCVSAAAQLIAVGLCWKVYKLMQLQAFSGIYTHPGDVGDASASGLPEATSANTGATPAAHTSTGAPASGDPLRSSAFTPFQGTGHQLTD